MGARRRGGGKGFDDTFSFGGRVPAASGFLLAALLVFFLADNLARGAATAWFALWPVQIAPGGQFWRLATWSLLEAQPISLIFAALWIWQTGGQLAYAWGTRRFLLTWFGMTVGAGLAQLIAYLLLGGSFGAPQASPWPILVALLLMWAMQSRGAQMSWFGVLPMSTETLSWVILGGTVLFTIASPAKGTFVTNFAALAIAYALAGPGLPFRRWWYRFRAELHVRQSRRRAEKSRLKVVGKNGQDEPPRWMN
jgi:membrane associated rhomboid family serine protease